MSGDDHHAVEISDLDHHRRSDSFSNSGQISIASSSLPSPARSRESKQGSHVYSIFREVEISDSVQVKSGDDDEQSRSKFSWERCCSHFWFFIVCCGFVIWSSLARTLTVLDLIVSSVMYFVDFRKKQGYDSASELLSAEFSNYRFNESGITVMVS